MVSEIGSGKGEKISKPNRKSPLAAGVEWQGKTSATSHCCSGQSSRSALCTVPYLHAGMFLRRGSA